MGIGDSEPRSSRLLRTVIGAYRRGVLPPRGYGKLFDHTPAEWWGGQDVRIGTQIGEMVLPLRDHGARQYLVFGELPHERAETAMMRRLLPRLRTVIDVGASYGWYTRLAADLLPAGGTIVAIEANPTLRPYLLRNAGPRAEVLNAAIAGEPGETMFYLSANSSLSSAARPVGTPLTVSAVTLDQVVHAKGGTADLIKCDVEGGELAVLAGSRQVRAAARPPIWLIEVIERFLIEVGGSYADLDAAFASCGRVTYYQATDGGWLRPLDGGLHSLRHGRQANVVVVPEQRTADVADLVAEAP
jgi:FkbM family methyltransferase